MFLGLFLNCCLLLICFVRPLTSTRLFLLQQLYKVFRHAGRFTFLCYFTKASCEILCLYAFMEYWDYVDKLQKNCPGFRLENIELQINLKKLFTVLTFIEEKNYWDTCYTGKEDFIQDYCNRCRGRGNRGGRSGSTPNPNGPMPTSRARGQWKENF